MKDPKKASLHNLSFLKALVVAPLAFFIKTSCIERSLRPKISYGKSFPTKYLQGQNIFALVLL